MPVKEKLSGISLLSLLPKNSVKPRIIIKDEALSSSPFIISKHRKITSPFTGRIKELDYLRTLYSETIQRIKKQNSGATLNSKPIIAAIKGEPGIGKSRLVSEFIKQITKARGNDINSVLAGKNLNTGQEPCGMFRDIIPGLNTIGGPLNADESNITLNNTVKEYLYKKAIALNKQNAPLTLVFEDMQWADEMSLSILEHILKTINIIEDKDQPQILIVLNYRNNFKPSKVLRTESDYRELTVQGLGDADTTKLIESLLPPGTSPGKLPRIITDRSDGNPFNIEEWCALLCSSKKLSKIPQTIKHLLVDKVSSLNPEERSILIIASVLGRKFELKIVNEILKLAGKPLAAKHIMKSLEEKLFIVNLTGDVYEFRHDILQETIYSELRKDVKQNVHLLAGEAIENLFPGKLTAYFYGLARHYTAAKNEEKSIYYLEKAGDKAKDNYEHERALRHFRQLLKMISGSKSYEITFKMCDVHMNRSEWNKQIELCESILKTSPRLDKNIKAECYKRIANCLKLKGEYQKALSLYKNILKIFKNICEDIRLCTFYEEMGKLCILLSKYEKAANYFRMQSELAEKLNSDYFQAKAFENFGLIHRQKGNYTISLKLYEKSLEIYNRKNYKEDKIKILDKFGTVYFHLGNFGLSEKYYLLALKTSKNILKKDEYTSLLGNLGVLYISQNLLFKAKKILFKKVKICKIINDYIGLANSFFSLGNIFLKKNQYNEAKKYYSYSLNINLYANKLQSIAYIYSNLGILHQQLEEFTTAEKYFFKQYTIEKKLGNKEGQVRAYLSLGILNMLCDKFKLSEKFYKKAQKIARRSALHFLNAILECNLADIYSRVCNFNLGIKHIEEAVIICKKYNFEDQLFFSEILNIKILFLKKLQEYKINIINQPKSRMEELEIKQLQTILTQCKDLNKQKYLIREIKHLKIMCGRKSSLIKNKSTII